VPQINDPLQCRSQMLVFKAQHLDLAWVSPQQLEGGVIIPSLNMFPELFEEGHGTLVLIPELFVHLENSCSLVLVAEINVPITGRALLHSGGAC
jgi:hypothetical protein